MFEHTLVKRQRSRRRGWLLALAVTVHGVGLTTVVLASGWSVDEVAPPLVSDIFAPPMDVMHLVFEEPRQEPAAPPPPVEPPPAPPVERAPTPEQPAPPVVQPTTLTDTVPTDATGPEVEPTTSTGGDTPADAPTTGGGGTDPNAPTWGSGGEGDLPVALDARMTRPETIFRVDPRYTETARKAGRQGVVVLRATIDRTGAVTDVRLVKPLGMGLDESAISAVRQWRFTPATMQGRPVPVFFQLTVTFTIR
jgi:periplasmic protein TonB